MAGKRRFGVSIDEALADALDRLAGRLGVGRSKVVEEAVKAYIGDLGHLLVPHECRGVIVAACPKGLGETVEEAKGIVEAHLHAHAGGDCIEVLVVNGESKEIARLYSRLLKKGCTARYLPAGSHL